MKKFLLLFVLLIFFNGCSNFNKTKNFRTEQTQLQIRSYQSRSFDTQNRELVLRTIISTLQDLGFIVEKVDEKMGIISGTLFFNTPVVPISIGDNETQLIKTNISVRNSEAQIIVRLNASKDSKTITDPTVYQNFFNSLSQSLFLEANNVD